MVSKQPCSSARTVTMSSIQPDNDRQYHILSPASTASTLRLTASSHSPKVKMNFSFSIISRFCRSLLPWNRFTASDWKVKIIQTAYNHKQLWRRSWMNFLVLRGDLRWILTAHNSKSKIPSDQTSLLGPEGWGASSCDGSLGWKQPWAITSGARYDG